MPYPALDAALLQASARLDSIRQDLYFVDSNIVGKLRLSTWRQIHGTSYVHLAACLEFTVNELLRAVVDEVNARHLAHRDLRMSLFALIGDPQFKSIASGTKDRHDKRTELFALLNSSDICRLNNAVLPLDGRTLRPAAFTVIWEVFGLPMSPMPRPTHALALTSIADARNDVAHGSASAEQVSKRQPIINTLAHVERAEELLINLHTATEMYLDTGGFQR